MPYIKVSAVKRLTDEQQEALVTELGEALGTIPGKDKQKLIVDLEDGKTMFVGGVRQENFVFADVRYLSNFSYQVKKAFTMAVLAVLKNIFSAADDKVSLNITELHCWGGASGYRDLYYSE